jgi:hypothetical protein
MKNMCMGTSLRALYWQGLGDFYSKTKRILNVPCGLKRAQSQATLLKSGTQIPERYKAPLLRNVETLRCKQST